MDRISLLHCGPTPRLNRILALKELGLSLEQIQQLINEEIDNDGVRHLYTEHKSQIEQSIREELLRLQQLQMRLNLLDSLDTPQPPDVVLKQIPPLQLLSLRESSMSDERMYHLFEQLSLFSQHQPSNKCKYGSLLTVLYSELFIPEDPLDLEIGFFCVGKTASSLHIADDIELKIGQLPAVPQMATIVHKGLADHPITYNALGCWLEENQYHIVGPGREILLENHYPDQPEKCVLEIQFPVERLNLNELDLLATLQ